MSEPIMRTERDLWLASDGHQPERKRANTESASPPRVPGASAQFAKVGVQSGPGQPIDICERMNRARDCVPGAELRMLLAEGEMEIRRLRAESESRYRAGIEEAAQAAHDAVKRFTAYQSIYPAKVRDVIRALADKPPADEMELRPEVAAFARLMERELRTNDARRGAAGWKGMTAAELLRMLDADAAKLRSALGAGDATKAIEQCADVANMAMMIADVTEIAARKGD